MTPFQQRNRCGLVSRELKRLHRAGGPRPELVAWGYALLMVLSAGALFWFCLENLRHRARDRAEVAIGLIEMRSRSHQILAGDWAHWSPTLDFLQTRDPSFVQDEVNTSTLIQDGQILAITNLDGDFVYNSNRDRPAPVVNPQQLNQCLNKIFHALPSGESIPLNQTWGLFCSFSEHSVIGAVTAVTNNDGTEPAAGWLMHMSLLQRPSYSSALNQTFAAIGRNIHPSRQGPTWPPILERVSLDHIDQLTPLSDQPGLELTQNLPSDEWARDLLSMVLLPWLVASGVISAAAFNWLLQKRRHAMYEARHRRLALQHSRTLQREVRPGLHDMASAIANRFAGLDDPVWLVAIQLELQVYHESYGSRSLAHDDALGTLASRIEQQFDAITHRGADRELLLACVDPDGPGLCQRLEQTLASLAGDLSSQMQLDGRAVVARQISANETIQAFLDLTLVLQTSTEDSNSVRLLESDLHPLAQRQRQLISRDLEVSLLAGHLDDHGHRLEELHRIGNDSGRSDYGELLFRIPESLKGMISVQDLFLSLERSGTVHLVDHLMVKQAIKLIRISDQKLPLKLATNISASTLQVTQHRKMLIDLIQREPLAVRKRLVLEITETALLGDAGPLLGDIDRLHSLGVMIAIDDFGVGHASLNYLFQFRPNFIKLDLKYTQTLHDPDIDALVVFLLSYCRNHQTCLILEGIETKEQLHYWTDRGVRDFQGYLFSKADRTQPMLSS